MISAERSKPLPVRGLASLLDRPSFTNLSEGDLGEICSGLRLLLTHALTMIEKNTEIRCGWVVKNLCAESFIASRENFTLQGSIEWLTGDFNYKTYRATIALNTTPLMYTFDLINKDDDQQFSIRKSYNGWALAQLSIS